VTGWTPSQTVGPFFRIGFAWMDSERIGDARTANGRISIRGRLLDGAGEGIGDGMLEVWQADPRGHYADGSAPGFGRIPTAEDGSFAFTTFMPGRVPGPERTLQAPHLLVSVFARGMLKRAATRMYFPGATALDEDPILALVEPQRRATLVAKAAGPQAFEWNVVLQGAAETVFFDL